MTNFDITSMNCQDLAQKIADFQKMIGECQKELDTKNQKIAELKTSVFATLHQIEELSGNADIPAEIIQEMKSEYPDSTSPTEENNEAVLDDAVNVEVPEQHPEFEETVPASNCVEDVSESEKELIPSLDELMGIKHCDFEDAPVDSFKYRNEEEYNLCKKRQKMIPPLDSLLSGELSTKIGFLGYIIPAANPTTGKKSPFLQNARVINGLSGAGNTLTASAQPIVYVPLKASA